MSYLVTILDIAPAAYDEIRKKLQEQDRLTSREVLGIDTERAILDMDGIALRREEPWPEKKT